MKILCVFGEYNYGDPSRGQGYEYTNFIPALRRLGHEVVFFESLDRKRYTGFVDLNRAFLETVEREQPDVVICVLMHYEIWTETLRMISDNSDVFLINWSTDDSWKYEQFSRFVSPSFHLYATTDSAAILKSQREGSSNFVLTQWAANAEFLREPLRAVECRYKVSFVGSAYGGRARFMDELGRKGIHVECFGQGWQNGPVDAAEIPGIIRESVISLNLSDPGGRQSILGRRKRQIKARIFEVTGAGGFLITQSVDGIDRFFKPEEEIIVFDGIDEAAAKIKRFLSDYDDRDRIALAGYRRTSNEHVYDIRFRKLLDGKGKRQDALRRRVFGLDHKVFVEIERLHKAGKGLQALKKLLTYPCVLLWGEKRGPRAARRLLFEISWRLFGGKTYSSAGLPGRLFYRES